MQIKTLQVNQCDILRGGAIAAKEVEDDFSITENPLK